MDAALNANFLVINGPLLINYNYFKKESMHVRDWYVLYLYGSQ